MVKAALDEHGDGQDTSRQSIPAVDIGSARAVVDETHHDDGADHVRGEGLIFARTAPLPTLMEEPGSAGRCISSHYERSPELRPESILDVQIAGTTW